MIKHNGKAPSLQVTEAYNTTGSERSSFLNWLQERVQKEMDDYKEQKIKSRKPYDEIKPKPKVKKLKKNEKSKEERDALVRRVNHLRDEGLNIAKACKEVGMSTSSYYDWL
jgi:LPS O-antigen subunit length determinant protein (WzzB/FepE family)